MVTFSFLLAAVANSAVLVVLLPIVLLPIVLLPIVLLSIVRLHIMLLPIVMLPIVLLQTVLLPTPVTVLKLSHPGTQVRNLPAQLLRLFPELIKSLRGYQWAAITQIV